MGCAREPALVSRCCRGTMGGVRGVFSRRRRLERGLVTTAATVALALSGCSPRPSVNSGGLWSRGSNEAARDCYSRRLAYDIDAKGSLRAAVEDAELGWKALVHVASRGPRRADLIVNTLDPTADLSWYISQFSSAAVSLVSNPGDGSLASARSTAVGQDVTIAGREVPDGCWIGPTGMAAGIWVISSHDGAGPLLSAQPEVSPLPSVAPPVPRFRPSRGYGAPLIDGDYLYALYRFGVQRWRLDPDAGPLDELRTNRMLFDLPPGDQGVLDARARLVSVDDKGAVVSITNHGATTIYRMSPDAAPIVLSVHRSYVRAVGVARRAESLSP